MKSLGGVDARIKLRTRIESWPLRKPLRITGSTILDFEVLIVEVERNGRCGRGEAMGVGYRSDRPAQMRAELELLRSEIELGDARQAQRQLASPGARNGLDCALWDLESKECKRPVWALAGLRSPKPLLTTYTIGAADPVEMAAEAAGWSEARALKLKLTGEPEDGDRVRAVRHARPDVWIGVDANQGLTPVGLERLLPTLLAARISLIEQPFPASRDDWVDDLRCPIPLAADESVQDLNDLSNAGDRWDVVNIKLDKCGGLTEALAMAAMARRLGIRPMIGSMGGTSLALAPAFTAGQLCDVVDLDGPIFLGKDREPGAIYQNGFVRPNALSWGGG